MSELPVYTPHYNLYKRAKSITTVYSIEYCGIPYFAVWVCMHCMSIMYMYVRQCQKCAVTSRVLIVMQLYVYYVDLLDIPWQATCMKLGTGGFYQILHVQARFIHVICPTNQHNVKTIAWQSALCLRLYTNFLALSHCLTGIDIQSGHVFQYMDHFVLRTHCKVQRLGFDHRYVADRELIVMRVSFHENRAFLMQCKIRCCM